MPEAQPVEETASASSPVEFDDATMTKPAMVSGPDPEYTQEAIERRVQGQMTVKCVIGADGGVHACRVLKGLPFMSKAVLEAIEQRHYRPATARGKPVDVYYTFNVRLTLPQ
jgi:protein TonB